MGTPAVFRRVAAMPGCDRGTLRYAMGHTHCNMPHPHGYNGTGFMVAGQGMEGCGNYGVPIIDSTEGRLRMWYFPIVDTPGFDKLRALFDTAGPQFLFSASATKATSDEPAAMPFDNDVPSWEFYAEAAHEERLQASSAAEVALAIRYTAVP